MMTGIYIALVWNWQISNKNMKWHKKWNKNAVLEVANIGGKIMSYTVHNIHEFVLKHIDPPYQIKIILQTLLYTIYLTCPTLNLKSNNFCSIFIIKKQLITGSTYFKIQPPKRVNLRHISKHK